MKCRFYIFLDDDDEIDEGRRITIKGQMLFMDSWDAIMFIGTPV